MIVDDGAADQTPQIVEQHHDKIKYLFQNRSSSNIRGHHDQRSHQFLGMDVVRIRALEKMLAENGPETVDRNATVKMLQQKCAILANGSFKHGRIDEAEYYLSIQSKYKKILNTKPRSGHESH